MNRTRELLGITFCLIFQVKIFASPQPQTVTREKATATLPVATEELLGELSPQTEPPGLGGTKHFWKKEFWSEAVPEADYNFDVVSLHFAARAKDKWVKMLDDKELGPAFEKLGEGSWFSSDAGLEHHAYPGKRGKKWLIVVDGKEGPEFFEVGFPHCSRDGQHLAYRAMSQKGESGGQYIMRWVMVVDREKGTEFDEVSPPVSA